MKVRIEKVQEIERIEIGRDGSVVLFSDVEPIVTLKIDESKVKELLRLLLSGVKEVKEIIDGQAQRL